MVPKNENEKRKIQIWGLKFGFSVPYGHENGKWKVISFQFSFFIFGIPKTWRFCSIPGIPRIVNEIWTNFFRDVGLLEYGTDSPCSSCFRIPWCTPHMGYEFFWQEQFYVSRNIIFHIGQTLWRAVGARKALETPYWVDMSHMSNLIMFYNRYLYVGSPTLESSGRLSCWAILRGSGRCQTQNLATKLLHMVY